MSEKTVLQKPHEARNIYIVADSDIAAMRDKLIELGWIPPETLDRIRDLPGKWRQFAIDGPVMEGRRLCADELEAELAKVTGEDDG